MGLGAYLTQNLGMTWLSGAFWKEYAKDIGYSVRHGSILDIVFKEEKQLRRERLAYEHGKTQDPLEMVIQDARGEQFEKVWRSPGVANYTPVKWDGETRYWRLRVGRNKHGQRRVEDISENSYKHLVFMKEAFRRGLKEIQDRLTDLYAHPEKAAEILEWKSQLPGIKVRVNGREQAWSRDGSGTVLYEPERLELLVERAQQIGRGSKLLEQTKAGLAPQDDTTELSAEIRFFTAWDDRLPTVHLGRNKSVPLLYSKKHNALLTYEQNKELAAARDAAAAALDLARGAKSWAH